MISICKAMRFSQYLSQNGRATCQILNFLKQDARWFKWLRCEKRPCNVSCFGAVGTDTGREIIEPFPRLKRMCRRFIQMLSLSFSVYPKLIKPLAADHLKVS